MSPVAWAKLVRAVTSPEFAVRQIIRRFSIGSLDFRLALDALDRPFYAFGVKQAIYLASRLKHPKVSVIEFGVATGGGLLALEKYALELGKRAGIEVEVYGFDTGEGLPAAVSDYRDLGYVWKQGAYKMDVEKLTSQLTSAKLLLGNVSTTMPQFLASDHAPIGFISFDMDYYSSTKTAFQVFAGPDKALLPRVMCYFDDVVSDGHQLHCDLVGERLAIREFNENHKDTELLAPMDISTGQMFSSTWLRQFWVYHRVHHREYNTYIGQ